MRIIQVDLNKDYSEVIAEAVFILENGGTIVYPTDTLYGMGANALNDSAVRRIFELKERSFTKPLPIIIRNKIWLKELAYINSRQETILSKVWPGRVTVILAKKKIIPEVLTAKCENVGIRIPDYIFTDKLLARFGYPLTSSSANISGQEPTNDINKIIETFSGKYKRPDLVIDAGILPKSDPSIVIDLTNSLPKILRVGPSSPTKLLKLLNI